LRISILCPSCKARRLAPDNLAGRKVKCPECGSAIAVPRARPPALAKAAKQAEPPTVQSEPDAPLVEFYEGTPDVAPPQVVEQSPSAFASPTVPGGPAFRLPTEDKLWYGGGLVFALLLITGLGIRSCGHEIEESRRFQASKNQFQGPNNQIQDPKKRVPGR
jgi:hypothetical protein